MTPMLASSQQSLKQALKHQLVTHLADGNDLVADELRLLLKMRSAERTASRAKR